MKGNLSTVLLLLSKWLFIGKYESKFKICNFAIHFQQAKDRKCVLPAKAKVFIRYLQIWAWHIMKDTLEKVVNPVILPVNPSRHGQVWNEF